MGTASPELIVSGETIIATGPSYRTRCGFDHVEVTGTVLPGSRGQYMVACSKKAGCSRYQPAAQAAKVVLAAAVPAEIDNNARGVVRIADCMLP